tara:strand:+ start:158 stop:1318 length:1161 start_codon:yes stop_codon:yes gene_type:complete
MLDTHTIVGNLVLVLGEESAQIVRDCGTPSVRDVAHQSQLVDSQGHVYPFVDCWEGFTILIPEGMEETRDAIAMTLGDTRCRWNWFPVDANPDTISTAIGTARLMWTDEICVMSDVADQGPVETYKTGFGALDDHGWRIVTPAFMPVIGPYGSGKSVFLRQLLVNLWRMHGWKFLLTSFEEKIKPRYQRDIRRNLINKPEQYWTDKDKAEADLELDRCACFLRRKRGADLTQDRLIDRIAFAVKVHGVRVVCIDPVNEIDHQVPRGESKTDYMGRFIMSLKQLADDYNLLMIVCAHPPKDGVEKRLSKNGLLTLNDGADTAHWGNKADIGVCLWRNLAGPTILHLDKLKDHESMGKPTLAELHLDERLNQFHVGRVGYDIMGDNAS